MKFMDIIGIGSFGVCAFLVIWVYRHQAFLKRFASEGPFRFGLLLLGGNGILAVCALLGILSVSSITPYLSIIPILCFLAASAFCWRISGMIWRGSRWDRMKMGMAGSSIYLLLAVLFLYGWAWSPVQHAGLSAAGFTVSLIALAGSIFLTMFFEVKEQQPSLPKHHQA